MMWPRSFFLTACLLLPSAFAQPAYQSGNTLVYPPPPYTYSLTTFSTIGNYFASPYTAANGNLGRARGQWSLTMSTREDSSAGWSPVNCSNPGYGSCPWQQTLTSMGEGQIKVEYNWINKTKNWITMINTTSMIPTTLEFYMCYSNVAFDDRPWRKKNKAYPSLTQNCYFWISTNIFPANVNPKNLTLDNMKSGNYTWDNNSTTISGYTIYNMDYNSELPTASLFFMMWVRCSDGNVCAFESTESPSILNSTGLYYPLPYANTSRYVTINGYTGITPGMTAAAIILSVFGPLFFIGYFIADHMYYTKTGKALMID